jgi:hypothetical protein
MIRVACFGAFFVAFAGPASATGGCGVVVAARHKERAFATGGRKVCRFGMSTWPRPGQLPPCGPYHR